MPSAKWSQSAVVMEIRDLHRQGEDLSHTHARATNSKLVSAAVRYFGSWREAVTAAGIDYSEVAAVGEGRRTDKIVKWSKEKIIEEIQRLHALGEELSASAARNKHLPLYGSATKPSYFGGWKAALEAAGIDEKELRARERRPRNSQAAWKRELLEGQGPVERGKPMGTGKATAAPGWAKALLRERLHETESDPNASPESAEALRMLADRYL